MQRPSSRDFTTADQRKPQKERVVAAWQRLQRLYKTTGGPDIFASYKPQKFVR